jgi:hypothetical protein
VELGKLRRLSWPVLCCPVVIRRRSGSRAALDHLVPAGWSVAASRAANAVSGWVVELRADGNWRGAGEEHGDGMSREIRSAPPPGPERAEFRWL